jgi:uncharacterized protein YndB with AHSA1/START domain
MPTTKPTAAKSPNSVRLVRRFDASPERVFDAWVDPAMTQKWLFTLPHSVKNTAQIDARIGGTYNITDQRDGQTYTAIGEYLEIDRPRRLVFTFGMPQFSPDFDRLTVEIVPDGSGCIVTLIQEDMQTGYEKSTKRGWNKMFKQLAVVLGKT